MVADVTNRSTIVNIADKYAASVDVSLGINKAQTSFPFWPADVGVVTFRSLFLHLGHPFFYRLNRLL